MEIMEEFLNENEYIHLLTMVEILGAIDHKIRGIQQVIIALEEIAGDSTVIEYLDDLINDAKAIQTFYRDIIKIRDSQKNLININEFISDRFSLTPCFPVDMEADRGKLEFVFNTIMRLGGDECKISCESSDNVFNITFHSPSFCALSLLDMNLLSDNLLLLDFYAAKRIVERMSGRIRIAEDKLSIEFSG
ncbi:hypothetical protein KAW18_00355 [candidate division WOR-3 bacterium]|nr:hypothetical protein [candidate division WOR-3 bacterium]